MGTKVGIIGIQGIGMAHAIACETLGIEVSAVLDTDLNAASRLGKVWKNRWGPHIEEIEPKSKPLFTNDVYRFQRCSGDLLIIACPTVHHIPYLCFLQDRWGKFLVEKPLSYSPDEMRQVPDGLRARTWVGHEWLVHPDLITYKEPPLFISHSHGYPPKERHKAECGVIWDLGTHACAELLSFCTKEKIKEISPLMWYIQQDKALVCFRNHSIILVEYTPFPGEETIIGRGHPLLWKDLFSLQIERVLNETHPGTFTLGEQACSLIAKVYPFEPSNLHPGPEVEYES